MLLGLPHTNYAGLSEPLLMMHAGHCQWTAIARAIGVPLSALRTQAGGEVYGTFYFIEISLPADTPLESFGLDDQVRFAVSLRAFKNLSVEGHILFDRPEALAIEHWTGGPPPAQLCSRHPWIHFGNIFITPVKGNSVLRVAAPANGDFSGIPQLPNAENPYHITKEAASTGTLGVIPAGWTELSADPVEVRYSIDLDRDTNGAGLVYFANYFSFMQSAERRALTLLDIFPASTAPRGTSLRRRRVAYYGNVDVTDAVRTQVRIFSSDEAPGLLGFRYAVHRETDGVLICLSEALKALPDAD
jgi:probable biosynthetic protein (TIGR04098 family)